MSEIPTPPEIVVGTQFHALHANKTTRAFLPADGQAPRSLLPSSVFLLSGTIVQSENTYSSILRVTRSEKAQKG